MIIIIFCTIVFLLEIQAEFDFKIYWKEYSGLDDLIATKNFFLRFKIINYIMDLITNLE